MPGGVIAGSSELSVSHNEVKHLVKINERLIVLKVIEQHAELVDR